MNIENEINKAFILLKKNNIQSAKLDSEILMSSVLKKNRKFIILNSSQNLKKKSISIFRDLINKRSKGKPIAYLTGKKEFWKNEFNVNEDVLVPRPDTELIVEQVLEFYKNKSKLSILDIGVGSGCILLSVILEKKNFQGVGIDINKKSLDMCKKNTLKLKLGDKVKFFKSDVDNFNYGKYDLIVSNPPYINSLKLKYLESDIIKFEPRIALDGGLDGMSEIRKVVDKSSELIKKNGKLFLEIGFDQKYKAKKILKDKGFYINKVVKDLAKNDRCIISTKI